MEKYDFIAIDFETANENFSSACSIGLVAVKNNKIIHEYYSLIQPPTLNFNPRNIDVHGITAEDVKTSPKFVDVWNEIKHFFDDNLITAYNASFDMQVLRNCFKIYNIDFPNFEYICAMNLASLVVKDELSGKSLKDYCKYFKIELNNHHNALADTKACAEVVINIKNIINSFNIKESIILYQQLQLKRVSNLKATKEKTLKDYKSIFKNRVNIHEITANCDNFDTTHSFYNKSFVFTGELQSTSRKDAMQKVVDLGGIIKSGVSKTINYLIVGIQDKKIVGEDGISSKERKTLELIEKGYSIKILSEAEFLELLEGC